MLIIFLILLIILVPNFLNQHFKCESSHANADVFIDYESPEFAYKIFNPSIITLDNGDIIVCARKSNPRHKNLLFYALSNVFYSSTIVFMKYNSRGILLDEKTWPHSLPPLEDPRAFIYHGELWVSATQFIKQGCVLPILIKTLNYERSQEWQYDLEKYYSMKNESNMIKNWCPFEWKDKMMVHTDSWPRWIVCQIIISDSRATIHPFLNVDSSWMNPRGNNLRCSTSWIRAPDGKYIAGLHNKVNMQIFPIMRSKFAKICPETLIPLAATNFMCFDDYWHHRVQFLSGLSINTAGEILIGLGYGDYKFVIYKVQSPTFNFRLINEMPGKKYLSNST